MTEVLVPYAIQAPRLDADDAPPASASGGVLRVAVSGEDGALRLRDLEAAWPFGGSWHFRAQVSPPGQPHVFLDLVARDAPLPPAATPLVLLRALPLHALHGAPSPPPPGEVWAWSAERFASWGAARSAAAARGGAAGGTSGGASAAASAVAAAVAGTGRASPPPPRSPNAAVVGVGALPAQGSGGGGAEEEEGDYWASGEGAEGGDDAETAPEEGAWGEEEGGGEFEGDGVDDLQTGSYVQSSAMTAEEHLAAAAAATSAALSAAGSLFAGFARGVKSNVMSLRKKG